MSANLPMALQSSTGALAAALTLGYGIKPLKPLKPFKRLAPA